MIPVSAIRLAMILLAVAFLAAPRTVLAAPYAAIVMDMRNGEVLHSQSADRKQHPASLTKMMTLYLTFEAVRDGRLKLDQKVRVSRNAARQPASKLYLRAGQRVTIRSLIRATAIKSANDAAMVLAETIGGSQRGFAQLMTRTARRLGMKNTQFRNPHGLTQSGHYSTARDMAELGRRLFYDFPEYYNIFQRKSDRAAGKRIWTTNRLLSSYEGADGIKTGYTQAAGYNLVASAYRGSERILAVVMGAKSSRDRTARMTRLLDLGFDRAPRHAKAVKPRNAGTLVARAPAPAPRPGQRASALASLNSALISSARAALPSRAEAAAEKSSAAPHRSGVPQPRPGRVAAIEARPAAIAAGPTVAGIPIPEAKPGSSGRMAVSRTAKRAGGAAPKADDWSIQVGAYATERRALSELVALDLDRIAVLADANIAISRGRGRSGSEVYRIRASGLDAKTARKACSSLKARGRGCAPIAPGAW